jgi:ribonuclease P protein component
MLPKKNRLTTKEVTEVLRGGKTVRTSHFLVRYLFATQPKFAVVVSKKVAKSSVERHAIRRAVYADLQHHLPYLPNMHAAVTALYDHTKNKRDNAYHVADHIHTLRAG